MRFFVLCERRYVEKCYAKIGENCARANFSYDVTKMAAIGLWEILGFRAIIHKNVPLESCRPSRFT